MNCLSMKGREASPGLKSPPPTNWRKKAKTKQNKCITMSLNSDSKIDFHTLLIQTKSRVFVVTVDRWSCGHYVVFPVWHITWQLTNLTSKYIIMACRENFSISMLLIKPEVQEIELKNKKHTDESKPKAKKPTKKAKDQDWDTSQQRKNIQCL